MWVILENIMLSDTLCCCPFVQTQMDKYTVYKYDSTYTGYLG